MIRFLRSARGRSALVALTLSALLTVTVSGLAHDGSDDAVCDIGFAVPHDGPAQIGGGHVTLQHADHCVLCHASQTVRALLALPGCVPPSESRTVALSDPAGLPVAIVATSGPARAPPRA
ncbi:MAG: hypothetical protein U0P30_01750 [Vicinamibacterales bacterium]